MKISTVNGPMDEPKAIPVSIAGFEDFDFALTRIVGMDGTYRDDEWAVTEVSSGMKIGPGLSKYAALCYAAEELHYQGREAAVKARTEARKIRRKLDKGWRHEWLR